ncbi:MAG: penicillin-binding transpeptidase domain-containing protein [Candidatus Limnocylindrus sp.]
MTNPQVYPGGGGPSDREVRRRRPLRFFSAALILLLTFGGLGGRLMLLQIGASGSTSSTTTLARGHRIVEELITPARGLVYDRSGRVLAKNVAVYAVQIRPGDLSLTIRAQVVKTLGEILNMDPVRIITLLDRSTGSLWEPIRIANNVNERAARLINEERASLPGVETIVEARRVYPFGTLISHIVGYVGRIDAVEASTLAPAGYTVVDFIGRAGVEASYEEVLRGSPGIRQVEVDAKGRIVRVLGVTQPPVDGSSLTLTIDIEAQQRATTALEWGLKGSRTQEGVVASMNPQNGEIIAMASLPTYDNNDFSFGISSAKYQKYLSNKYSPLLNHTVGSYFPPGSTYKLVTYSCALNNNLVTPTTRFRSTAFVEVDGEKFYEWNRAGFGGSLTPAEAYSWSSNVVTFQLARLIKIDRLAACGRQWGFGALTGIDLPSEIAGLVPDQAWARTTINRGLYNAEVLQSAQGQGYDLVTPLQVLNSFSALANSGTLWRPHVVLHITDPSGAVTPVAPIVNAEVGMRESTYREMRIAGRKMALNPGPSQGISRMPLYVSAKSGTAQYGVRDDLGRLPFHNWMGGFVAPSNDWSKSDSTLAFVVFMHGTNTVGNAAKEVTKYYLQLQYDLKRDYRTPALLARGNFFGE